MASESNVGVDVRGEDVLRTALNVIAVVIWGLWLFDYLGFETAVMSLMLVGIMLALRGWSDDVQ